MPLSRAPRTPDVERVVQVLSGDRGVGGWVPSRPGGVRELPPWPVHEEQPATTGGEGAGRGAASGRDDDLEGGLDDGGRTDGLADGLRRTRRPGLFSVPEVIRSGRLVVSSTAVVAVLALVVALACAFVVRILWAERTAAGERVGTGRPVAGPASISRTPGPAGTGDAFATGQGAGAAGAAGTAGAAGGAGAGAPQAPVVVHVVGQVRKPGLVRLTAGARVADAIAAAGGTTSKADLSALNLARPVTDGEQVLVPRPGEAVAGPGPAGGPGTAAGPAGAAGPGPGGLVNLNTADVGALDTLPGVGPVLAQRILDWRTEHGRFTSVEELGEVSGIGDKMMSQLRTKVTV